MQFTKKVFSDLTFWMLLSGMGIGVIFPLYVQFFGIPASIALRPAFFAACTAIGVLLGVLNYGIGRLHFKVHLKTLAVSMNQVEKALDKMIGTGEPAKRLSRGSQLPTISSDEIGESAGTFNRMVESLSISMQTQAAVRSFSHTLNSQLTIEELAERALCHLQQYIGAVAGLIVYEYNDARQIVAAQGIEDPQTFVASTPVREVLWSGQSHSIPLPAEVQVDADPADGQSGALVILPITNGTTLDGAVILVTKHTFADAHLERFDLFAQILGLALSNARINSRLQHLAAVDPLTGVFNRRFGMRRLQEEFSKAQRDPVILGVLILDIDHFKVVNDTYGHLVGDTALKSVCALAQASLRGSDIFFRYGGEEFVAVLPASSVEDLYKSGERLRRAIEGITIKVDNDHEVRVSVSIGGASYPDQPVDNVDQLIQLADEALYLAKNSGRNNVRIARKSVK